MRVSSQTETETAQGEEEAALVCQRNVNSLTELLPNLTWVGPEEGWQACRTKGAGRMSEPETILAAIEAVFA